MPKLIEGCTIIHAAGNKPKRIEEYVGRVNSQTEGVSVARMISPEGWIEPGQTPEFDEYTVVLKGTLHVITKKGDMEVKTGQAILVEKGEWVQYSSPEPGGAEYIAVCLPAFSPDTVHRDTQ
jgi:mannose-6-phosphate isomerase-like protein (cupin superfamily)